MASGQRLVMIGDQWNPAIVATSATVFGVIAGMSALATVNSVVDGATFADWLGFAGAILGSIAGGLMTLGAAFWAWTGVQQQIREQRRATQIALLIAERDYISERLPGLMDAQAVARRIGAAASRTRGFDVFSTRVYNILMPYDEKHISDIVEYAAIDRRKCIDDLLPRTEQEIKSLFTGLIADLSLIPNSYEYYLYPPKDRFNDEDILAAKEAFALDQSDIIETAKRIDTTLDTEVNRATRSLALARQAVDEIVEELRGHSSPAP